MKEVEQYKKENDDLRNESAQLKMQVRQLSAAQIALDQSYANVIRELQQMKTQVVMDGQDKQELSKEIQTHLAEIANLKVQIAANSAVCEDSGVVLDGCAEKAA